MNVQLHTTDLFENEITSWCRDFNANQRGPSFILRTYDIKGNPPMRPLLWYTFNS